MPASDFRFLTPDFLSSTMPNRLHKKTCIVTGAATGIGEAIALLAGEEGGRVVVADVDESGGESTAAAIRDSGGEALFVRCDVSREEDVAAMTASASMPRSVSSPPASVRPSTTTVE